MQALLLRSEHALYEREATDLMGITFSDLQIFAALLLSCPILYRALMHVILAAGAAKLVLGFVACSDGVTRSQY